jgi:hypothetical protein
MDSDFLRKKARTLERLADACFDIDTSRRLRELADEFQTVADKEDGLKPPPAFLCGTTSSRGNGGIGHHRRQRAFSVALPFQTSRATASGSRVNGSPWPPPAW